MVLSGNLVPATASDVSVYPYINTSSDGTFNPSPVQASSTVESTLTFSSRDVSINAPARTIGFGPSTTQSSSAPLPIYIVEQELVRMVYGEGSCRTDREKLGLAWVARNRVGDSGFGSPSTLSDVVQAPGEFAGYTAQATTIRANLTAASSRQQYDHSVDQSGMVQESLAADPSLGSVGFVTPDDGDINVILNAYDSGSTINVMSLTFVQNPGFTDAQYQAVLVLARTYYDAAALNLNVPCDNPFIYFRRKQPSDPTVVFNP